MWREGLAAFADWFAGVQPRFRMAGVAVAVISMAIGARVIWGPESVNAEGTTGAARRTSGPQSTAAANKRTPDGEAAAREIKVAAVVNGQKITLEDLGRDCLKHFGEEVLESLVNKYLIAEACRERNLVITEEDVALRIEETAIKFGLPKDQFLKMLDEERHIKPSQYANDIVWPSLALEKLAAEKLTVSKRELEEARETYYGPAIRARLIALDDRATAEQVHTLALANPDDFGNLAKQFSKDVPSASAKGMIQPIRMHVGDKAIERAAFALSPGQVSEIIPVEDQFVILKCEMVIPGRDIPLQQVASQLTDEIRDKKLRAAADEIFTDLQSRSSVENIFNDPVKRKQLPGVAAKVNDREISVRELASACVERHGPEVLEGTITKTLLLQACGKAKVKITEADIDDEIARAAVSMGVTDAQGRPDVEAWLKQLTEEQGMSLEAYRSDVVWPTAALKKLIGATVEVTEEDLQKGFEANFSPRVRCRAIVLNNQRKAQEVWQKARENTDPEFFGDLAEQYSIESSSRQLRGEVPPIQRHGGQEVLEREAFALEAGELSGVIQVGREQFVVLLCEGRTEASGTTFEEARDEIAFDIHEKKLRIAMAKELERLQSEATIQDNLTKKSHKPQRAEAEIEELEPGAEASARRKANR